MLEAAPWILEYFSSLHQGNGLAVRAWTALLRTGPQTLVKRCDECAQEDRVDGVDQKAFRILAETARRQMSRFGRHLCASCAGRIGAARRKVTMNDSAHEASRKARPSWQSKATPEELLAWKAKSQASRKARPRTRQPSWQSKTDPEKLQIVWEKARKKRNATNEAKTPEQRSQGARNQWATMSDEVKKARAEKIGAASKARWAAYTAEDRSALVKRIVKGLPRSGVSDAFRQVLVVHGLYAGFASEVAISGFIVDECNQQLRIIIEFFGDYYHCNPRRYKDPNFYNSTIHMTAEARWAYDRKRLSVFRLIGYRTLVVWEDEWRTDPEMVLAKVRDFIDQAKMRNNP